MRTIFNHKTLCVLLVMGVSFVGLSQKLKSPYAEPVQDTASHSFNVKLLPAFFWNTSGLEVECKINKHITLGVNGLMTLGQSRSSKTASKLKPQDYMQEGFRAEIAAKYYFKIAPDGFYAQLSAGYNNIVYSDGSVRPFALYSHGKEFTGLRTDTDYKKPNPLNGGLGIGYQLIIIPKRIVANAMIGAQANMDGYDQFFLSVYFAPSIGLAF